MYCLWFCLFCNGISFYIYFADLVFCRYRWGVLFWLWYSYYILLFLIIFMSWYDASSYICLLLCVHCCSSVLGVSIFMDSSVLWLLDLLLNACGVVRACVCVYRSNAFLNSPSLTVWTYCDALLARLMCVQISHPKILLNVFLLVHFALCALSWTL